MQGIIFFIVILFVIKITQLHTNLSLLLALLITYFVYYNDTIKNQIKMVANSFKKTPYQWVIWIFNRYTILGIHLIIDGMP